MEKLDNVQKQENYREQFGRLNKALAMHFYLEAIFIEYAIMEDRAASVLSYEHNEINAKEGAHISIDRKLRKISTVARENRSLAHKYFEEEFINSIIIWKEERNKLIHALLNRQLTTDDLQSVAETGKTLARKLSSKATLYKRTVEKQTKQ